LYDHGILAQVRCPDAATQFERYGLESITFSSQLLSLDVVCVFSCSIITNQAVAVADIILPHSRGWDLVKSRLLISAREFAR